jgi:hypothetical protein
MINVSLLSRILRAPADVARDCRDERGVRAIAEVALLAIVLGAALFGAAAGSFSGVPQALLSAGKMPIVSVATLVLCAPALYAIAAVLGRPWTARTTIALLLVAGARFALVLLAAAPVLWLAIDLGVAYDVARLIAALAYALAGLAALTLLLRGLEDGPGKKTTIFLFIGMFLVIGAQSAWVLRPYIGATAKDEMVLVTNEREGGLAYQLWVSVQSFMEHPFGGRGR